jgi:predicted dehydrogenase
MFHFEVYCENGYISVEGLGASYDTEKLTIGMKEFSGPFKYEVSEFRGKDISWMEEWREFHTSVKNGTEPLGNGRDGLACMNIALKGYQGEKNGYTKLLK